MPWSEGARVCPGKKFGQVEFVAAMVAPFRKHRVEGVPEEREGEEEARERVLEVVRDSGVMLLLQMRKPESVRLRWVEKETAALGKGWLVGVTFGIGNGGIFQR